MIGTRRVAIGLVLIGMIVVGVLAASRWMAADRDAVVIDVADVPFSLLRDSTSESIDRAEPDRARVTLFFVYQGALVPVARSVPDGTSPLEVIDLLLQGPTADEIAAGLSGFLNPESAPERVVVVGTRALVDLSKPLQDSTPGDRRDVAIAQLVYTLTALPEVSEVRFLLSGAPVEVPLSDGTLTRSAVNRENYPVQVLTSVP